MVDRTGVREALAETRRYLLSHHEPSGFGRCYAPVVLGRRVRLCARCSGIYPGIAAGLVAHAVGPPALTRLALVALLPLPALVDWSATAFTSRRGANPVRTATGAALGYGYGVGLGLLFGAGDRRVPAVGAVYGAVAFGLLSARRGLDADSGDGVRSSESSER